MQYKTRKGMWVEVIFSKHQRKQIMQSCHSDPTAGHLGRTRTFYKVSERFYWPGIFKDVEKIVCILHYYYYIVLTFTKTH